MNLLSWRRRRAFVSSVLAGLLGLCIACTEERPQASSTPPETRNDGTELAALWLARHNDLTARLAQQPVELLFVGDSITHYWQPSPYWERDGGDVWEAYYGQRQAFNLGVAGDTTVHLQWRLENSGLHRISPKLVVVNIGTNNHAVHSLAESVRGVQSIVRTLLHELPRAKVLLLAVFPRGETAEDAGRRFVAELNRRSSPVADGDRVHFLDIGNAFLAADGTLSAEIMPDFLHLTEKGYAIWARAMEPKIRELLGE